MTHPKTPPKCKHCPQQNYHGQRYGGYCLDCSNCGVPELVDANDALRHHLQVAVDWLELVVEPGRREGGQGPGPDWYVVAVKALREGKP